MNEHHIACCGATNALDEIDGQEFVVSTLDELIAAIKEHKVIHLAYWGDEDEDLDLWIRRV